MNEHPSDQRSGAILFTDLVGFTAYTEAHGDRSAVAVLDRQHDLVTAALDGRGRIVKELGDGLMVWFDEPTSALDSTCGVLAAVGASHATAEFPLAVRMGMHVGEVIERGTDFIGSTVNIAARVAGLAGPGELLVTEQFLCALDDSSRAASFRPVGPTRVKGVSAPIWLHRLAI
jgi:adenylate cyclase